MFSKKIICIFVGFLAGMLNVTFGTGGGLFIVPSLIKLGLNRKEAHANSICTIFVISVISVALFSINGFLKTDNIFPIIIWGVIGSIIGTFLLKKINKNLLKKIFAFFTIWAAITLIFT